MLAAAPLLQAGENPSFISTDTIRIADHRSRHASSWVEVSSVEPLSTTTISSGMSSV